MKKARRHEGTKARRVLTFCAVALALGAFHPAAGQVPDVPDDTEGIGITERVGEAVPLELVFIDEDGRRVPLREYFGDDRPVMLTLVYYTCPGICNALLNGLAQALSEMEWTAGQQFRIVTVSIDPSETPELAGAKKRSYLGFYDRPEAADGWRFLTGGQAEIEKLAEAVGFGYRYEGGTGLYTHAASLMICTPDGRLSRYLNDVIFEPQTLQLALTEASKGSVGSPMDRLMLTWCDTYDSSSGRYVVAARKVMMIGGAGAALLTLAGVAFLWLRERGAAGSKRRGDRAPHRADAVAEARP